MSWRERIEVMAAKALREIRAMAQRDRRRIGQLTRIRGRRGHR